MKTTLVVGATGQLGTATVRHLLQQGMPVRAMVRRAEDRERFEKWGAEPCIADLTDPQSTTTACNGVAAVIATASAAIPSRPGDTFERVERQGYRNLLRAAKQNGVRKFIYTSALQTRFEPVLFRLKRETERLIQASGLPHVILRADAFMDVAFAMMGSSIPIRGAENATVLRPFGFSRNHFAKIAGSIERDHVAMVPGDGTLRHAFLSIDDVVRYLAAALDPAHEGMYDIAGPEAISPLQVVEIYERLLGVRLRVKKTPAWVFRAMGTLLSPFQPAAANLMQINYVTATEESAPHPETARRFGIRLTSAGEFLEQRWNLPPVV